MFKNSTLTKVDLASFLRAASVSITKVVRWFFEDNLEMSYCFHSTAINWGKIFFKKNSLICWLTDPTIETDYFMLWISVFDITTVLSSSNLSCDKSVGWQFGNENFCWSKHINLICIASSFRALISEKERSRRRALEKGSLRIFSPTDLYSSFELFVQNVF